MESQHQNDASPLSANVNPESFFYEEDLTKTTLQYEEI